MPLNYEQKELLQKLKKVWEREPGLRFCQLVDDVADPGRYPAPEWDSQPHSDIAQHCIFFTPDRDFRDRLEQRLGENE